jgi:hypoxanthine phosphoribosyltransferase
MKELINAKDILIRTKILSQNISREHQGDKTPVVMVGLLNGAFMFYADLVRGMSIDIECDFMRVKSYISKNKQGDIQITKDLETPVKGKHVYIVDDIYDTGNTMEAVIAYLEAKHPASLSIVTLVKRKTSPKPKQKSFHAFTIDDEWLIGMGMDDENKHNRNLPSIWAL